MATTQTLARTSPRTNKTGFTLIELTVVITVLALFAAAIMPNIVREKRGRAIRQFFPEVRNALMAARSKAIGDGATRTIRIDDGASQVIIERTSLDTGEATQESSLAMPDGVTTSAFRLEKDDSNAADWRIGFYADGRSEGGAVEFSADGRAETLMIDPNGTVRFLDGDLPDISDQEWDAGGYEQRI